MHKVLQRLFLIVVLGGCSTTYEPHLILPPTEFNRSIDAVVEVHPFVASDDLLSGHTSYGVVADDYVNQTPSKLTQVLTEQVIAELSAHRVFRKVTTYDQTRPHFDWPHRTVLRARSSKALDARALLFR